jgi:long-chain-fatty-acid--CoA ligase ACSBG
LYGTNNAEANKFILEDCKANILVVEEERTVNAILPYWDDLPHLKKIIIWGDKVSETVYSKDVLRWENVMQLGMEENNVSVLERQKDMAINQCCVLIYTSGTTGNPKGSAKLYFVVVTSYMYNTNVWINFI